MTHTNARPATGSQWRGWESAYLQDSSRDTKNPIHEAVFMPKLVPERIKKLREEIAEISEANRTHTHRRDGGAAADHERRLQRLQEILDELMTLTDWKKT